MPKKEDKPEVKAGEGVRFYKGYDLKWLAKETNHPDYYLVEEAEGVK